MDQQEQILIQHTRKYVNQSQMPLKPIKAFKSIQEIASTTAMATLSRKFQKVPLV